MSFFLFLHADEGVKKVVFDLTTGDINVFKQKVLSGISYHKSYYEGKLEELKVAVVIHGDAYKFFIKELKDSPYKDDKELLAQNSELQTRIATLFKMNEVEFLMCQSGMEYKKIDKSNVYEFIKIVPNAAIGLIDKQNQGYAYIPISH
jgi:intracellular sulfur oxidation DsrE/DsrF family protein